MATRYTSVLYMGHVKPPPMLKPPSLIVEIRLQPHWPGEVASILEVARTYEGSGLDMWYLRALG